jgi:hypothetical protein
MMSVVLLTAAAAETIRQLQQKDETLAANLNQLSNLIRATPPQVRLRRSCNMVLTLTSR